MDRCHRLIERQMYPEALKQLTQILKNELDNPQLETLYLINGILSLCHKYKNVQIKVLELMVPDDNDDDKYSNLQLELINLYIDCNMFKTAKEQIKKFKQYIQTLQGVTSILFTIEKMEEMMQYKSKTIDLHEQYSVYNEYLEIEKKQKYFDQDGMPAYLIPARWFNKWNSYVQQKPVEVDFDVFEDVNGVEELKQLLNVSFEIEIEEQMQTPGPINGSVLIQLHQCLDIDPFTPKQYTNYILKENLREGQDYILVGYKIYEYLKDIYGGFDIKRLIIEHHQTHQKYVDLVPRIISYCIFPITEDPVRREITANSSDFVLDLSKKIKRIYNIDKEIRWWKFHDDDSQNEFIRKIQQDQQIKTIGGSILERTQSIEEINFSGINLFICEISQKNQWILQETNLKQIQQNKKQFNISEVQTLRNDSRKGLTGLQNLGNTCFMNAALQCLSNTYELTEYMVSNQFSQDLNPQNPLGTKGYLATAYAELMKTMWFGNNSAVSAYDLKRVIGKFAPQFYGYGQQDSHEFLMYLLDGLHEDLNRIRKKPQIKDTEITNESDYEASQIFWNNYILRNKSHIQQLMAGQYKSTLICPNCQRISKTFDPFLSLSLPIPSFQFLTLTIYFIYQDGNVPSKINLQVTSDQDAQSILYELEKLTKIKQENINLVLIKDYVITERIKLKQNIKWISEHEGILFAYQIEKQFHNLNEDQIHIDSYYCKQTNQYNQQESILSFPKQFILNKNQQIKHLYFEIYKFFRIHLMFKLEDYKEQLLQDINDIELFNKSIPTNLDEYIEENKLFKGMLFQLTYKGKSLKIDNEDNLEKFNSKILIINIILNPFLIKNFKELKINRCQDLSIEYNKQQKKGEYSLEDCIRLFSKSEVLGKGDEWYCNKCKQHVQASKQMEIYKASKILIIHLKRFRTNRVHNYGNFFFTGGSQKITTNIHFPKILDLNQFILQKLDGNDNIDYTYELFGVDNHYGGLGGGHYTACAYNSVVNKWIDYNDSSVRVTSPDVESEAAYVLFYRRQDSLNCQLG